ALAGAIHNVDRGRTPVLIYAGASPFSANKELKGGRNEWIMWLQVRPVILKDRYISGLVERQWNKKSPNLPNHSPSNNGPLSNRVDYLRNPQPESHLPS
ncbi:hypothetical protein H0H93_000397, partial [Arthromyces matolae]